MNLFSSYIFGNIEDQIGVFTNTWWNKNYESLNGLKNHTDYLGYPIGTDLPGALISNQPLFSTTYLIPSYFINTVFYTNFYTLIQIILNYIFAYIFFRCFDIQKKIALLLSLILTFSPFLYYNLGVHPALMNYWPLLIFFILLLRNDISIIRKSLYMGSTLAATFLFNNYFGYFGAISFTILTGAKLIFEKSKLTLIKEYLASLFTASIIILIGLIPYFKNISSTAGPAGQNSIEDFFYFTSRPWYYFLPSPENPWLGNITTQTIEMLQNKWGYWLTSNYFPNEHTISFLGWTNLILAILGAYYIFKVKRNHNAIIFGVLGLALILLSMPPYITISMYKIYLPSYLLLNAFPMFRSLTRLGLITLLIELIYTGYGYQYILKLLNFKHKALNFLIVGLLGFLGLLEFYVPITFTKINETPAVYTYIKESTPADSVLTVYPYNAAISTEYWIKEHQRKFINPRGYMDSEDFTQDLQTEEGILKARDLGATYLIFFKYAGNKTRTKEEQIFNTSAYLTKITELNYENELVENHLLYKIKNLGNSKESSAIIYRVNLVK